MVISYTLPTNCLLLGTVDKLCCFAGHWAEEGINTLINLGAIKAYADGTFKPNSSITRAEFVSVLVKEFKLEYVNGKVFDDTLNHWAKDAIATAQAHGIYDY